MNNSLAIDNHGPKARTEKGRGNAFADACRSSALRLAAGPAHGGTRARKIRQAPIAMKSVSATGGSSGSIDVPSAMPTHAIATFEPLVPVVFTSRLDHNAPSR
jgi:hypothetical protein